MGERFTVLKIVLIALTQHFSVVNTRIAIDFRKTDTSYRMIELNSRPAVKVEGHVNRTKEELKC